MKAAALVASLCLVNVAFASGQQAPRVIAGWGVDTLTTAWIDRPWQRDAAEVFRLWAGYLRTDAGTMRPTAAWSAAEQQMWPVYDFTAGSAYKGFPATILDIRPSAQDSSVFVIRTLFASATGEDNDVRPVALTTVYATRENGRWVLSNALPRHTRDWQRATVDRFTFVVEGRPVDLARARRTVQFADSLATMFGVPRLERVTYYAAQSPQSLHRAMGIDWTFGAQGAFTVTGNGIVLNGQAALGEEHRHEITHLVLARLVDQRTHGFISEGLATWFGGCCGHTYPELRARFATYLAANPQVTLAGIIAQQETDTGWHPGGAALVDMVYRAGGVPALQQLLHSGRFADELRATVMRLLGIDWPEVERQWKQRALER